MSFDRKMLQIYVSFFALLPCTIAQNEDIDGTHISVEPPMNKWPIIWHQAVTISCAWTPLDKLRRKGKAEGDIFVQQLNNDREVSIFADPIYGDMINLEDPKERVYFESNNEAGTSFLVIKNVTKEDSRRFKCRVNGGKISDGITLEILEPPVKEVSNFVASPGYDKAELSWDAVVGAITYIVKYQLLDAQQWEMVEVENPNVTIEYLDPATEYKALVSASNTAGIRANVLPAEIVFKTGGFKVPCSAGDFMTKTGCKQCGENSYSSNGASSCISCPPAHVSAKGSSSFDDCKPITCLAGNYMTDSGCKQCGENTYSADGASSCISCPNGKFSAEGSTSNNDCESRDTDKPDISIQPSVENGPIIWHQTVVISCSWPLHALHEDREPEIFVQRRDNFIYIESDIILNKTISLKDPEQRVYYEVNKEEGTLVLVIKNVTKEDSGTFMCWMYRGKRSDLVKVDILEPPMSVTNLVATPAEDTVKLTWDAVGRDTTYTVQYKPNDAEEWTEVHSVLSHLKIEHLIPATEYIARVSAANSAGIRDGLVPVEITFFSKEKRKRPDYRGKDLSPRREPEKSNERQMEYFNFERYLELTTVDIYKQLRAANEKKKAERYKHDGFNKNENVLVEVIEDKVKRSVGDLIEKRADNCRVFNKKGWSICKN
ncbi:uncharacterized protein LOC134814199 isoform X6 [Bolinopsis microptera]|uniref:uncharacterized protein LOC134814199 isoform X6 n=1 Tax=Bolinopsis microptera TaxID=2820187 RepID=UPI003078F2A9